MTTAKCKMVFLMPDSQGKLQFFAFTMGHILQDGAAHKLMFGCKGDAGTRFCFICKNLVAERACLVQDEEDLLVCKLHKTTSLKMASDAEVFDTIDRLVTKKTELSAADFKLWQQACGFAHSEVGMLFDPLVRPILKPVTAFIHDWMHCILSNGVFATCMATWLESLEGQMNIYQELSAYLPLWHLPHHQRCKLELLFTDKKKNNKDSSSFKCSASEALALLPILCYFIQLVLFPAQVCLKECQAISSQRHFFWLH